MEPQTVRIVFKLDAADWHAHASERLWADPVEGSDRSDLFQVKNRPFLTSSVSFMDVVRAERNQDQEFEFRELVLVGGHSTYMVLEPIENKEPSGKLKSLLELGCDFESTRIRVAMGEMNLYSLDVPPLVDIYKVFDVLQVGEDSGDFLFQQGHVGHKLRGSRRSAV